VRLYHTAIALLDAGDSAMVQLENDYDEKDRGQRSLVSGLICKRVAVHSSHSGVSAFEGAVVRASVDCAFYRK
jgi:hypothetical protein